MSDFLQWILVIAGVLAIFNAEKLPALRLLMKDTFKTSFDAAKEQSIAAKQKIEQVKSDLEAKKNTAKLDVDPEENTEEEMEEALKFMAAYTNKAADKKPEEKVEVVEETPEPSAEEPVSNEDAPIDLENR